MKRKFSAILATSILVSNNAFAVNEKIFYDKDNGEYTLINSLGLPVDIYDSLGDLNTAITPRIAAGDVFTFNTGSLRDFLVDLFNDEHGTVNDFIATYNAAAAPGNQITADDFRTAGGVIEELIEEGNVDINAYINELEKLDYATVANAIGSTLEEGIASFRSEAQAQKAFKQTDSRVNQVDTQIKALNDQIKALETKINAGQSDLQSQLNQTREQLFNSDQIKALRKTSETQEELKTIVKAIQANFNSSNRLVKTSALDLLNDLKNSQGLYLADASKVAVSDLPQVQKPDTQTTGALLNSSLTTNAVLSERISGFSGIASGDDTVKAYGAWAKGTYSKGQQQAFKADPGYDFSQMGVTIGADIGDESLIGAAYSFFKNEVKSKSNASTKDKIDTHVGNIYGMYAINPQVFVSGQAGYGFSKIDKRRVTGDLNNNIATAKPDAHTISGKAEVGYAVAVTEVVSVVPTVGISYSKVEVKGYTEKGNGLNRKVGKRHSERTSALGGASVKYLAELDNMKVVPELHANVDYAFSTKNSATTITLVDGLAPLVTPSEKISKAYYNVGTSVKVVASDAIDVSAGYDLGLSKKFMSHTGALKLRIKL